MNELPDDAVAIRYGKRLPKIYISGPYSNPSPDANLMIMARVSSALASTGLCLPWPAALFSHAWEERLNQSYEFWIEYTKHMLDGCDVLFRIPGESSGADGEVALARELGIPVLSGNVEDGALDAKRVLAWLNDWHMGKR